MMKAACLALFFVGATFAQSIPQLPKAETQSTVWNSSFKLSEEQLELGKLWPDLAESIETILNFDRSQLAHGGPSQDDFYKIENEFTTPNAAGELIKVEDFTDPAFWNLPATTALSRFIYTTTNANGTLIPASAYVLWPFTPKKVTASDGKAPVVLWSHGTSGFFADGSPSSHRSLFYGNIMPFTLAQAGYAVVATDYAGLGVQNSWDGSYVPHQYLNRLANAFDSLFALRAARSAFPDGLTDEYVNVGHSQGGSAAWGVSEVLAENTDQEFQDLEKGYLGSVLFAPGINALESIPQVFGPWIGKDLALMYPTFNLSDWLSPLGIARTELLTQIQGGQYVSEVLFLANASAILNPAWDTSWYNTAFSDFSNPGNRPYKAPMVLFQGTADQGNQSYINSLATFESTCENHYSGAFEFVGISGVGHFPSMESTRHLWLQWIEDRFNGKPIESKENCTRTTLDSFLPISSYQEFSTSFSQWAGAKNEFYELVAGGF